MYQRFFKNARNPQNPRPLTVRLVWGISQSFSSLPWGKKSPSGCLAHPRVATLEVFKGRVSPCVLPVSARLSNLARRNSSFGLFLTNFYVKVTQFSYDVFGFKERLCSLLSFGGAFFFQNITDFSPRNRDELPNLTPGSLSRGFFLRLMPGRQEYVTG